MTFKSDEAEPRKYTARRISKQGAIIDEAKEKPRTVEQIVNWMYAALESGDNQDAPEEKKTVT